MRESSRTMFEQENDRRINDLSSQVSMLKEVRLIVADLDVYASLYVCVYG